MLFLLLLYCIISAYKTYRQQETIKIKVKFNNLSLVLIVSVVFHRLDAQNTTKL